MACSNQREEYEVQGYLDFDPQIPERTIDEAEMRHPHSVLNLRASSARRGPTSL